MLPYLMGFLAAAAVGFAVTPVIRRIAIRLNALDRPVRRSTHKRAVPHLGGLAIYLAFAAGAVVTSGVGSRDVRAILFGGLLVLALGMVDDFHNLRPIWKFLGQVIAAGIVVAMGAQIQFVSHPLTEGMIFLGSWSIPVTMFWIVAMMNVMNFTDGLDGLAAGVASIASLTLFVVSLRAGYTPTALLMAVLAGSTLGFLPHNFNPARIFMGDAGALFLGFTLAVLAIGGTVKQATTIALAVPMIALGLPIVDTALAITRRVANGRPFHQADRGHLHHRLMGLGLTQRQTVIVLYGVSAWLGLSAIVVAEAPGLPGFALVSLVIAALFYGSVKLGALQSGTESEHHRG